VIKVERPGVGDFARGYDTTVKGIPSGFTVNPQLRLTNNGYLTTAEAAARLEIDQTTVQKWYKPGLLQGKHTGGQKALWIVWEARRA
jgi:hypothetical protein